MEHTSKWFYLWGALACLLAGCCCLGAVYLVANVVDALWLKFLLGIIALTGFAGVVGISAGLVLVAGRDLQAKRLAQVSVIR
jgi:hypothetical protein